MNNVFLFRKNEFPEIYTTQSADALPVNQPTEQNAYTFRARGFQGPDKTGRREIQGKPKVSRGPRGPPRQAPAEKEDEQTYGEPITINQQNDLTAILDEVRFAQERDFAENLQDMKQQARQQHGAGKNCYSVISEQKNGNDCYTVMTGGKKNINLESAIAMVKANGYTLFKSKLAQGAKRVRKSRAKSKF
jgi:hypothetical protein